METFVTLVGTSNEDIEVYIFHNLVDISIRNNLVDIANGLYHVFAFLGRVHDLGLRFVFQNEVAILGSHDEIVAQTLGTAEEFHMPFV